MPTASLRVIPALEPYHLKTRGRVLVELWTAGVGDHPELLPMIFGNYEKVIYLAQTDDPALEAKARAAADRLGLVFEMRKTGYGDLTGFLARAAGA